MKSTDRDALTHGADRLAGEVLKLVDRGVLDARSAAADALLDYASTRHGDDDPMQGVRDTFDQLRTTKEGRTFAAMRHPDDNVTDDDKLAAWYDFYARGAAVVDDMPVLAPDHATMREAPLTLEALGRVLAGDRARRRVQRLAQRIEP